VALLVLGSVIWMAVTANGISAGLVVSEVGASPLVGLVAGVTLSQMMLMAIAPASVTVTSRASQPMRSATVMVLIGVGLSVPVVTVALWNLHAHRISSQPVEQFAEACLVLLGVALVTWLSGITAVAARRNLRS